VISVVTSNCRISNAKARVVPVLRVMEVVYYLYMPMRS
jgi:hypothetical protein